MMMDDSELDLSPAFQEILSDDEGYDDDGVYASSTISSAGTYSYMKHTRLNAYEHGQSRHTSTADKHDHASDSDNAHIDADADAGTDADSDADADVESSGFGRLRNSSMLDLEEVGGDLELFQRDDIVREALEKGVDLRNYSRQIHEDLQTAEDDCIEQFLQVGRYTYACSCLCVCVCL